MKHVAEENFQKQIFYSNTGDQMSLRHGIYKHGKWKMEINVTCCRL